MRVPHDHPPQAPVGSGRVLVVGSVNPGLGRTLPRLPRGAEQIRTTRHLQAGEDKGAHQALAGLLALDPAPAAPGAVAAALERSGLGDSLVSLSSGGVVVLVQGATTHVPAFRVHAIDTAGAGDAIPGALPSSLTGGLAVRPAA
ncbi:PfkB family carbohydrate kinase [Streptomyces sp. NEAU-YJ-81]|uniref:PfkB family carbohydrate kinase n=1 Tax=Streptomyces sp. NEAU-YJ-81 TaxID=2820288 RepID=UPI001ABD3060|nr:PfkB family carbohydrate kinase [Streptomyces sp. NEAU-YJ-81]MBO3678632.1 hypothetical protein [Streptomyces sp. NEAU-YJ-81]